jgi:hypothetical protein
MSQEKKIKKEAPFRGTEQPDQYEKPEGIIEKRKLGKFQEEEIWEADASQEQAEEEGSTEVEADSTERETDQVKDLKDLKEGLISQAEKGDFDPATLNGLAAALVDDCAGDERKIQAAIEGLVREVAQGNFGTMGHLKTELNGRVSQLLERPEAY